jgi:hypothetical protein
MFNNSCLCPALVASLTSGFNQGYSAIILVLLNNRLAQERDNAAPPQMLA